MNHNRNKPDFLVHFSRVCGQTWFVVGIRDGGKMPGKEIPRSDRLQLGSEKGPSLHEEQEEPSSVDLVIWICRYLALQKV